MDRALKSASQFVMGCAKLFNHWADGFKKHTNKLPRFDPETARVAGGDPNIAYFHSYWKLAPDEALVIETTPPECDYWNFQVSNHWLESLDYRYYPIHVNNHTATRKPDVPFVTTPQDVSVHDVRKAIRMFETVKVPVLGVVENMSYFTPPGHTERYEIFGKGGGQCIERDFGVPLLAQLPIDLAVREGGDSGHPVVRSHPGSDIAKAFCEAAGRVAAQISKANATAAATAAATPATPPPREMEHGSEQA